MKGIKKVVSTATLITILAYTTPLYAIQDSETIYNKLNSKGDSYKTTVTIKEKDNVKESEIKKELPIETEISYKLDGKEISPEDLVGKSGKVTITIKYINKSEQTVFVNGEKVTMYTPFMVAVGTIIDSENNKNIEVSNFGKIVEYGENRSEERKSYRKWK